MSTVTVFIILSCATFLSIGAAQAQTPAPSPGTRSSPEGVTGTADAPQVLAAPPQITFTPPRPAFKRPPTTTSAPSSAPSSAAQTAAAGSELEEVTVTAHRSISVRDGTRFYIESRSSGDPNDSLLLYENGRVCADQSLPAAKRLASCNMSVWMVMHGASMEDTDRAKVYVARGDALQQSGDEPAALTDFKAAAKLDPRSPRPWIGLGNLYAAKTDYLHAFENYDRAMNMAPDDPVVYDNRGTALESLGRHDEAIADFNRAIALDPHDTSAYSNRATAYLASNRQDLAVADLNEVIRAAPASALIYYDRGTAYELQGKFDKAKSDYREAVRLMPSFAPASAALGRLDSKDDPELALAEFGAAIRLDPKSPALRARALLYLSLAQPERALPDLDRVIANDGSDAIAWADRGVAKSKMGDFAGAIADCTHAIELAPTVANRVNRGNAYATSHRDDEALADFDMALQAEPRNLPALLGRASANYASKRLTASLDDYTRVIDADPYSAMAYFKRGNTHLDLKEFSAAFNDFSESLKLDPNQPAVLLNRSIAAARLGRRIDAANDQRRALALDPYIFDGRP
jgi:tetratricopeptide (TPR) repeat protein